jgi:hypothetical protein
LGGGYFEAKALNRNKTRVTGFLEINATGPMGSLANSLFKKALQVSDDEVASVISAKLEEFHRK